MAPFDGQPDGEDSCRALERFREVAVSKAVSRIPPTPFAPALQERCPYAKFAAYIRLLGHDELAVPRESLGRLT